MSEESAVVKMKRLDTGSEFQMPVQAFEGDAGFDIRYVGSNTVELSCIGDMAILPTGLAMEIPPGYEAQIRPRSGLAANYGVSVLNTPGTIDAGFRGEVKVILVKVGTQKVDPATGIMSKVGPLLIKPEDRIAQVVISKLPRVSIMEVDELSDTTRGEGGFGSSGTK